MAATTMFPKTKLVSISVISLLLYVFIILINVFCLPVDGFEYDPSNFKDSDNDNQFFATESSGFNKITHDPDTSKLPRSASASTLTPIIPKCTENCLPQDLLNELKPKCPQVYEKILDKGFRPDNTSVGEFRLIKDANSLKQCTKACCAINECNVALLIDTFCYVIFCNKGTDSCLPQPIPKESPSMTYANMSTVYLRIPEDMIRKNSGCEVGIDTQCSTNEVCKSTNRRSRNGHCECEKQFIRKNGECVPLPARATDDARISDSSEGETTSVPPPSSSGGLKTLQVSAGSKNITLPSNEATLYAYAVPEENSDNPYTYKWTLVTHPTSDPAQLEGQTTNSLKLTKLIQGTYSFQVTVTSSNGNVNGTANATIVVFAEKRVNLAPVAVISPLDQTVQLPTSSAVLDASSSTDDDKIVLYKWELQKGPIEYAFDQSKQSVNSSTLQIKDLIPGNYVFKLIVEDTDHITNSTTASVIVMAEIDYPPTANAGNDVVIYLPQTEVTLNGNASSDDKKIVQYEWKATGDTNKAVDIQDTLTPYLKLSHLQEGIYQFELRVTDEAGQQSNPSSVHVFVKPPTGNPPAASAGKAQTIALPQNWVILDASESTGDSKVVKWKWIQLSGPNNSSIKKADDVRTNVTGLTKGDYEFQVEIENDVKLSGKARVNITVVQKLNDPPKANAGDDKTVTLPTTLIELNGSGSKDDVKVTAWEWKREPDSGVAGIILGDSSTRPILQLTELIPGRYVFNLTVKDEQGLSDSDTVVLTVKEDPMVDNLVEIIIAVPLSSWTETDREKFFQQITLLLHDTKPVFHHVTAQLHSGYVIVTLYGTNENGETTSGLSLSTELRNRLHQNIGILEFRTLSVDTVLCLDHCSGHGKCQDISNQRECVCDAFWMENYLKKHYGNGDRNCEWSKIYVVVVSCLLLIMVYALFWSLIFLYRRSRKFKDKIIGTSNGISNHFSSRSGASANKRHNHSQRKQYTLLQPDEIDMTVTGIELESEESDSDISLVEVKRTPKGNSLVVKNTSTLSSSDSNPTTTNNDKGVKRNGILKQPRQNIKA